MISLESSLNTFTPLPKRSKLYHSNNCRTIKTVLLFGLILLCVFVGIGYMLCSVRFSSALSSHSCTQKYLLKTCSPNPFISLYLLQQTILLLQPNTVHVKQCSLLLLALLDVIQLLYWRVIEQTTHLQSVLVFQMERKV